MPRQVGVTAEAGRPACRGGLESTMRQGLRGHLSPLHFADPHTTKVMRTLQSFLLWSPQRSLFQCPPPPLPESCLHPCLMQTTRTSNCSQSFVLWFAYVTSLMPAFSCTSRRNSILGKTSFPPLSRTEVSAHLDTILNPRPLLACLACSRLIFQCVQLKQVTAKLFHGLCPDFFCRSACLPWQYHDTRKSRHCKTQFLDKEACLDGIGD